VVLSSDTRLSENRIRFSRAADLLIHEVAWARTELLEKSEAARIIIGLHTTPEEAGTVFVRVKPRLAVYSHVVVLVTAVPLSPSPPAQMS
jgi:ribonuclease Z